MGIQGKAGSALGVAVVTGASGGIGKVYADRLAKRGYDLILVARRKERLEALAQELKRRYGVHAEPLVADLGVDADLAQVANILSTDARITVLVNCAGTAAWKALIDSEATEINNLIDVSAKSVTDLTLAVLPGFVKRNSGTIINIGSVLSFFVKPMITPYSAVKAHVMLFTLGLREELVNTKVRVQLVLPATTETDIWDISGLGFRNLDPTTIMSAENCVDAALAGLDNGETVTLPSVEDAVLWANFDAARTKMFEASQTGKVASRYNVGNQLPATHYRK
jgi:short-subunit dehydrogenase